MANRLVARTEATRRLHFLLLQSVRELRVARLTSGLRLVDVARRGGLSVSRLSEIERGLAPSVQVRQLAGLASVLGLRISIKFYPVGRRLLDAGQLALLHRLQARISRIWRWETEVPMPIAGDLRAADARLTGPVTILVEAFTRLVDYQAQVRAAQLKRRDLGADRLLVLVAGTSSNRRAVRDAGRLAQLSVPVGTRRALAALADGRDPGGDALVVL
jgi:transcriptional regulator with XRE-family HTH domain